MQLRLSDPSYTDRLALFLRSLGQTVVDAGHRLSTPPPLPTVVDAGPPRLEVDTPRPELDIYLRVWAVLYPDAEVQVGGNGDDDAPAA